MEQAHDTFSFKCNKGAVRIQYTLTSLNTASVRFLSKTVRFY